MTQCALTDFTHIIPLTKIKQAEAVTQVLKDSSLQ
jgi:hypothetical protein